MVRSVPVAKCLDQKLTVLGFEVPDLFAIFMLLSVLHLFLGDLGNQFVLVWAPTFLTAVVLWFGKRGKPDNTRLPKLERAEIEEAIQKTYSTQTPRVSSLREILLNHPQVEIRRFGRILGPWCGDTPYGQFIDRKTTIELMRPIVVFDLKGMESHPDLQAVALFIITDFVWREVQRDRHRMKFLVFDECWRLLQSQAGLSFIEEVFRTFRKYYASAIAISQNIDDFAKSKIAGAILSNSATKWILMQKGADQKRLAEVLELNPNETALISSLRQERGRFSEAFLISGEDRTVAAVESTPQEYWLATTDPRDLAAVTEAEARGLASTQVLEELSQKYPRGVASS